MPAIAILTDGDHPRLRYVLDFLQNHPAAPRGVRYIINPHLENVAINIRYGTSSSVPADYTIPCNYFFFQKDSLGNQLPELHPVEYHLTNEKLFSVEKKETLTAEEKPFISETKFGFDIFETLFFHISRYEEWLCPRSQKDQHGRMPSGKMFLVNHGLHQIPVVDRLVGAFYKALGFNLPEVTTQIRITHDLDVPWKFPSSSKLIMAIANMIFYQRSISGLQRLLNQQWKFLTNLHKDPFDTFEWLFHWPEVKEKILYVLCGGTVKGIERHFSIQDRRVGEILDQAVLAGYKIGLHPSYNSFNNEDIFKREKEELEKTVAHAIEFSRQHFLRWSFPATPRIIDQNDIKEDSTLGFSDRIGFRCGTGFGYHLYDFENEKAFKFTETPLIVMDTALLKEAGISLTASHKREYYRLKAAESILQKFIENNHYHTKITFNIHNSTFDDVYLESKKFQDILTNSIKNLASGKS